MNCMNCDQPIKRTYYGNWVHEHLDVTYCASQSPHTVYNNWDKRVAEPECREFAENGSCIHSDCMAKAGF